MLKYGYNNETRNHIFQFEIIKNRKSYKSRSGIFVDVFPSSMLPRPKICILVMFHYIIIIQYWF